MFDPIYWLFVAPALLLALWANARVKSTYATAQQMPAPLSGAAAARHILDSAGLSNVTIEEIPGELSDHYDSHEKVLRLSSDVYHNQSLASVGIAAHESGHALQDAMAYAPLTIRNAAVPLASVSGAGIWMAVLGMMFHLPVLVTVGIAVFSGLVLFQVINLPVEFNASTRAKEQLVQLGIINRDELLYVKKVLDAAALTYVAATLQAVMVLLYLLTRFAGHGDRE